MTTRVIVEPANHNITVQIANGPSGDRIMTTETLSVGDAPRHYWVHSDQRVTVFETPDDAG